MTDQYTAYETTVVGSTRVTAVMSGIPSLIHSMVMKRLWSIEISPKSPRLQHTHSPLPRDIRP